MHTGILCLLTSVIGFFASVALCTIWRKKVLDTENKLQKITNAYNDVVYDYCKLQEMVQSIGLQGYTEDACHEGC